MTILSTHWIKAFLALAAFMVVLSVFSPFCRAADENDVLYGVSKYLLFYYEPSSITRPSPEIVRLKIKLVTKCNDSQDWTVKESPNCSHIEWDYVVTTTEINCRTKQDHDLESTGYDRNGHALESLDTQSSEWSDIDQDSYSDALYRLVCH